MLDNVVEINGLPLDAAARRDHAQAPPRHGLPRPGLHDHHAMHEVRLARSRWPSPRTCRARWRSPAGKRALELAREKGPAPIMNEEFTVTAEMLRKRPEMVKDGWKRGRARSPAGLLHAQVQPLHAARSPRPRRELVDELAEVGRALHASHLDRAHRHDLAVAGQQCLERHRALLRAPLFPQCDPRRQEVEGEGRRVLLRAAGLSAN